MDAHRGRSDLPFTRTLALLALCFAVLQTLPVQAQKSGLAPGLTETKSAIIQILAKDGRLPGHLQRVRASLKAHYVDNDGPVYWVGTGRMTPFIQRLVFAEEDGLKSQDYPVEYLITLRDGLNAADPVSAGFTELAFSAYFARYASDLKIGRFIPHKIDPKLFQARRKIDLVEVLGQLPNYKQATTYLRDIQPQNPHYRALKSVLRQYRGIADNGGWGKISAGPTLKPGMTDPRVPAIRNCYSN